MKLNKVLPFLLLLLSLSFISCGTGMGSDKETNNDVTVMNNVSILCTSDIMVPSKDGYRANSTTSLKSAEALSFIENDKVKPFTFITPSKKTFVLANSRNSYGDEVSTLQKFNNNSVAYGYNRIYQVTKDSEGKLKYTLIDMNIRNVALIDLKTSEVYDLNGYDIYDAESNKDYIFANSNNFSADPKRYLYKISIDTKKATPITLKPLYNFFVYDSERIIDYNYEHTCIYFINEVDKTPIVIEKISYILKGTTEEHPDFVSTWGNPYFVRNNKNEILIFAIKNNRYIVGKLNVITNENENKIVITDAVIDDTLNSEILNLGYRVYSSSGYVGDGNNNEYLKGNEILIVYAKPNTIIRLKITDTINVSFYNTTENLYNKKLSFNDDGIYFVDEYENKIKKYTYGTKSIIDVYQPSNNDIRLADSLCVTNDLIIFYEGINARENITYSLDKNGNKKQISSHQANIKQITNLDITDYL